ncbi:hypothetical protein, partial [Candidatus Darwinibacter acetoxidans]
MLESKVVGSNLGGEVEVAALKAAAGEFVPLATPIDNPDAAYLAATTKIDIDGLPEGSSNDSITDWILT